MVIGAAAEEGRFATLVAGWTSIDEEWTRALVVGGAVVLLVPLVVGLVRTSRQLAEALARRSLPVLSSRRVDPAAAPRRALTAILHLAILLLAAVLVVVVTQPFLPALPVGVIVLVLAALMLVVVWVNARGLADHAQAGAEVIVMAIAQQLARSTGGAQEISQTMQRVGTLLPGLGEPVSFTLPGGARAAGRTLAELNLRGLSGATVLAITRPGGDAAPRLSPRGRDRIEAGDVLALAGSGDAVQAAMVLLSQPGAPEDRPASP